MVILGIDPAIRTTGYGVLKSEGSAMTILDCGVIRNPAKLPHSECLRRLSGGIRELIDLYHPDAAALEDPFVGRNAGTAIILGMARGASVAAAAEAGVPCFAYSPRSAKRAAVGSGSAPKEQVASLLAALFGLSVENIPLDATDAISLALCHQQMIAHGDVLAASLAKRI